LLTQNRTLSGGGVFGSGLATQFAQSNITPDGNLAVIVSEDDLVYEDANGLVDLFVWRAGGRRDAEPRLAITKENANWVVRWPRGAADSVLQSVSDLSAPAWTDLPVAGTNTVFQIQLAQPAGNAFFRLKRLP